MHRKGERLRIEMMHGDVTRESPLPGKHRLTFFRARRHRFNETADGPWAITRENVERCDACDVHTFDHIRVSMSQLQGDERAPIATVGTESFVAQHVTHQ